MKDQHKIWMRLARCAYHWTSIIADPRKLTALPKLLSYFADLLKYRRSQGAEHIKLLNTYPCLFDKTSTTPFDSHYLYQHIWACRHIIGSQCKAHVDVGSSVDFVALLSVVTKVTFIDIRPAMVKIENLEPRKGSILEMPYDENSVTSLSCLHVAEHIGLGRYGDPIDPVGTRKAAKELSRILAPGGNLFFSLPIGRPRVCFNAHRVHSTGQILEYFKDLKLIELSGVDDQGKFIKHVEPSLLNSCQFGCGLFLFTKE